MKNAGGTTLNPLTEKGGARHVAPEPNILPHFFVK